MLEFDSQSCSAPLKPEVLFLDYETGEGVLRLVGSVKLIAVNSTMGMSSELSEWS